MSHLNFIVDAGWCSVASVYVCPRSKSYQHQTWYTPIVVAWHALTKRSKVTVTKTYCSTLASDVCCYGRVLLLPAWGWMSASSHGRRNLVNAYGVKAWWLIGAVVCLLAACRGSNCPLTRAADGRNLRCSTTGSCQSTTTSEIVKRSWLRWFTA